MKFDYQFLNKYFEKIVQVVINTQWLNHLRGMRLIKYCQKKIRVNCIVWLLKSELWGSTSSQNGTESIRVRPKWKLLST